MFFWDLGSSVRENNATLTRKYVIMNIFTTVEKNKAKKLERVSEGCDFTLDTQDNSSLSR